MNHPVFLRQLRSQNIYKISDRLKAFEVEPLPPRKIFVKQYDCRKNIKAITSNKKVQDYSLTTIEDQSFVFFEIKQTDSRKPSVYTLADRNFLEGNLLGSVLEQINENDEMEYQITGFRWDGFVIQFLPFSEDLFLLIITNEMISSMVIKLQVKDIQFKIKQGFEELLIRTINQKKSAQLIQSYVDQLRKSFEKHPELVTLAPEGKTINFNLVKYGKISELIIQEAKQKSQIQKSQRPLTPMQIQK